jgi:hypothetical protein
MMGAVAGPTSFLPSIRESLVGAATPLGAAFERQGGSIVGQEPLAG